MTDTWYTIHKAQSLHAPSPNNIKLDIGKLGVLFQLESTPEIDAKIDEWNSRHFRCRECKERLHTLVYLCTAESPLLLTYHVFASIPSHLYYFYRELQVIAQTAFDQCKIKRIVPVMCNQIARWYKNELLPFPAPKLEEDIYRHWQIDVSCTSPDVQSDTLFHQSITLIIKRYITDGEFIQLIDRARALGPGPFKEMEEILESNHAFLPALRRLRILIEKPVEPNPRLAQLAYLEFLVNSPYEMTKKRRVVCFYAQTGERIISALENARDVHALKVLLGMNKTL